MNDFIIKFKKPYVFEGETYDEIDLSALEDLSVNDLIEIEKRYLSSGGNPAYAGLTLEYAISVAVQVTSLPIEFFKQIPGVVGAQMRNMVFAFFYAED